MRDGERKWARQTYKIVYRRGKDGERAGHREKGSGTEKEIDRPA